MKYLDPQYRKGRLPWDTNATIALLQKEAQEQEMRSLVAAKKKQNAKRPTNAADEETTRLASSANAARPSTPKQALFSVQLGRSSTSSSSAADSAKKK